MENFSFSDRHKDLFSCVFAFAWIIFRTTFLLRVSLDFFRGCDIEIGPLNELYCGLVLKKSSNALIYQHELLKPFGIYKPQHLSRTLIARKKWAFLLAFSTEPVLILIASCGRFMETASSSFTLNYSLAKGTQVTS